MRALIRTLALALVALVWAGAPPAAAQQQQWAAAYVDWTFDNTAPGIGLAQSMWVPQPAVASFFTLNWDFTAGDGGYIGLQSDESGVGNARFSLWNATAARGDSCRPFDGEGEGMTCVLPVTIDPNGVYRVRIERGALDSQGQWWIGWLDEPSGQQRRIGTMRVAARLSEIAPATVHDFSEYWGDAVSACRAVPLSAAAFGAPVLTLATGAAASGAQPVGRRPDDHPCATGRERTGATAGHTPTTLAGESAMVLTLGGSAEDNRALAQRLAAD